MWECLEQSVVDLSTKYPQANFIIGADFNARVGNGLEIFKKTPNGRSLPELPFYYSWPRVSKDKKHNPAGISLVNFSIQQNLLWLNGLVSFEQAKEFTFISEAGCSVIDYVLVSPSLLDRVSDFAVHAFKLSDHLPLQLSLSVPPASKVQTAEAVKTQACPPKFRWDKLTQTKLALLLEDPNFSALSSSILLVNHPSEVVRLYNKLLELVTSNLALPANASRSDPRQSNPSWFDYECQQYKRAARSCFKKFRQLNSQQALKEYFSLNSHLNSLAKCKKTKYEKMLWEKLYQATIHFNPRSFWALVNGSFKVKGHDPKAVPAYNWKLHFSNLFFDNIAPPIEEASKTFATPNWPQVSTSEIKVLIVSFKSGKAAGPDMIMGEWLKSNPDFWAPILAGLFSTAIASGILPESWKQAVVAPIYKKGDPCLPENYRPISLLSIVGKLYANYLLIHLNTWITQNNILGIEQIGFRSGHSTLDHCAVLSHLAYKYSIKANSKLFVAFLDLKAAFDSVDRQLLWSKLERTGIPSNLINPIRQLYSNTSCRIRCSWDGLLTEEIPTNKGVKQGCPLAPTLFNLFLNDLAPELSTVDGHFPTLGDCKIPVLLYADDAVLISRSRLGLKRLMNKCLDYLSTNKLQLNYQKSKILVFSKSRKIYKWTFKRHPIEQVRTFKYLGLLFSADSSWAGHRYMAQTTAKISSMAISRFFYNKGGRLIPAALKIFNSKSISQALYGIPIWINAYHKSLESFQSAFLRRILAMPNCVPYEALCLETGQLPLKDVAWYRTCKYWLRMYFDTSQTSLLYHLKKDSCPPVDGWLRKIKQIGLDPDTLGFLPFQSALRTVKQRLADINSQDLLRAANRSCSPLFWKLPLVVGRPPIYISILHNPEIRRAISLARCNSIPSAVLTGRFNNIPFNNRFCPCVLNIVETLPHILFHCPFHSATRDKFFASLPQRKPWLTDKAYLSSILQRTDENSLNALGKFLLDIIKTNSARESNLKS